MIKRSAHAIFVDVTPEADTEKYERLGHKVTELTIAYNPQSTTEQDITQDTAETEVTGYQPSFPVSQRAKKGDPVYDYVNALRKKRAVLDECKTTIISVDLYDGDADSGYAAEKQEVAIAIDDYGGASTDPLTISYTVNYCGDPVEGTFDPKTKAFTAKAKAE